MANKTICCICRSDAIRYAAEQLEKYGNLITYRPAPDVTHLLLPVPSFSSGDDYLPFVLRDLPDEVIIAGGNLHSPLLRNYRTVDFLQDPYYLADNAAITAECALQIVKKKHDLTGCRVLILGWGRIGKCLQRLLQMYGAEVTVAARKATDLAMIHALGGHSIQISTVDKNLSQYQVLLNTIPAMVLPELIADPDCLILELASKPGMQGSNIISALGLPGKMAPQTSGRLIADTFMRLL